MCHGFYDKNESDLRKRIEVLSKLSFDPMTDLNTLSLAKLRELAKSHGIKNITKHSKSNLISLIEEYITNKSQSSSSSDDETFTDTPSNRITFYDLPPSIQDCLLYGSQVSILNESYTLLCNNVYVKLLFRVWLSSKEDHALVVVYKPYCIIGEFTSYKADLFILNRTEQPCTYKERLIDGMKMVINKEEKNITNFLPDGKSVIHNHNIYDSFMIDATNKILRRTYGVACNPLQSKFITFRDMDYHLEKEFEIKHDIVRIFKKTKNPDDRYAIIVVSTSAFWIKLFPFDNETDNIKLRGNLGNINLLYDPTLMTVSLET